MAGACRHRKCVGTVTLFMVALSMAFGQAAAVTLISDPDDPRVAFAVGDLKNALESQGHTVTETPLNQLAQASGNVRIVLAPLDDNTAAARLQSDGGSLPTGLESEGFGIRITSQNGSTTYWALGADSPGTMYGGLEIAEVVMVDGLGGIAQGEQNPHIPLRGLKMNYPLDERTPSFADNGDAAQENIIEMWNMDFWQTLLDNMASYRFNSVTLWHPHPFPSIVKVPDYPDIALDNVMRDGQVIKTITIDEKIEFWNQVYQYGADRGIKFYIITWNIHTYGVDGKYGINDDANNSTTIDYTRKCVSETFRTYPLLAGMGVTAGENMWDLNSEESEQWLWDTYGMGMMDVLDREPNRELRFIHRYWLTSISAIVDKFQPLMDRSVVFDFSFKYSRARLYSHTDPSFADNMVNELPSGTKSWWNMRNDDIFSFRWGDPDYCREYVNNFPPLTKTAGYHMGSDGYIWGREFTSTEPETPRQLEIEKHWYSYMLWGRLGYNPGLNNQLFEKHIQHKFPEVSAPALMEMWTRASRIIPAVNRFHWHDWDAEWAVEYCMGHGFHTITDDCWQSGGTAVAQEIMGHASHVLENIGALRSRGGKELRLTLGDLEAMAHLGNYYGERFLAAETKDSDKPQAAAHLAGAAGHWRQYAAVASSQYTDQRLARANADDWKSVYQYIVDDIGKIESGQSPSLPPTPGGTILEAEDSQFNSAQAVTAIQDHTGAGYLNFGNGAGGCRVEWSFTVPQAGEYLLEFRYVLSQGEQAMNIKINGESAGGIEFWNTGGSSVWAWDRKAVALNEGNNTVELTSTGDMPHIDHLNLLFSGSTGRARPEATPVKRPRLQSLTPGALTFFLPASARVQVKIYDLQGRSRFVVSQLYTAGGMHRIGFEKKRLSHGWYFVKFKAGGYEMNEKFMVMQ